MNSPLTNFLRQLEPVRKAPTGAEGRGLIKIQSAEKFRAGFGAGLDASMPTVADRAPESVLLCQIHNRYFRRISKGQAFRSVAAVSYTHLDVYKRHPQGGAHRRNTQIRTGFGKTNCRASMTTHPASGASKPARRPAACVEINPTSHGIKAPPQDARANRILPVRLARVP